MAPWRIVANAMLPAVKPRQALANTARAAARGLRRGAPSPTAVRAKSDQRTPLDYGKVPFGAKMAPLSGSWGFAESGER
jgi:hypothetical protein